jgi:uncharacterized membrane protein (DUF4010 family)
VDSEPPELLLGVRSFALLSMFGWVVTLPEVGRPWLVVAGLIVAGALIMVGAARDADRGHGLTTEIAALVTFSLGALVQEERTLTIAMALATTLLLISKPWVRTVVPRMRRMDLTSTLQLMILLAIVLPLLPTDARDPWGVLSPRKLGMFVAMIAGIGWVGYVLNRALGSRRSAGLTGIVGGLASSTAVTVAMAQQAKQSDEMHIPGQLAVLLASMIMFGRVLVVAALISSEVARALAIPLTGMAAGAAAGAFWKWRIVQADRDRSRAPGGAEIDLANPFSLLPALKWGLLLSAILVASAAAKQAFGAAGFLVTAAISGLMDVDAINLAASRAVAAGEETAGFGALAITIAVVSNTIVKTGIAWATGGRAFGADIAKVHAVSIAAGLLLAGVTAAIKS